MSTKSATVPIQPRQTRSRTTRELKLQLNAENPICRLPAEVLLLIFEWLFLEYEEAKKRVDGHWRRNACSEEHKTLWKVGWTPVSQVCHRWRACALGAPTLRSKIEVEDGRCRWALEMLRRSEGTLLNMYINLRVLDPTRASKPTKMELARATVSQAQKQLARCRELILVPCTTANMTVESFLSSATLPHLQLLSIPTMRNTMPDRIHPPRLSIRANSLRTLEVSCLQLDWNAPFVLHLVKLKLYFYPRALAMTQVLDYLSLMPSLRELELEIYILPIKPSDLDLIHAHPLNKSRLQLTHFFMLTESVVQFTLLLSAVAPKSLRRVSATVFGMQDEHDSELADLFAAISNALDTTHYPIKAYSFVNSSSTSFAICGICGTEPQSRVCDTAVLDIRLRPDIADLGYMASLVDIAVKCLPMSQLEAVLYIPKGSLTRIDWRSTFGTMSTLTTISASGQSLLELLESLYIESTLKSLRLARIICIACPSFNQEHVQRILLQSLKVRHQRGQAITELIVRGKHGLTAANQAALRCVIGKLCFEGDD